MHCYFPGSYCCTITAAFFYSDNIHVYAKYSTTITAEGNSNRDKICTTKEVFDTTTLDTSSRIFWTTALEATGRAYPHHVYFASQSHKQVLLMEGECCCRYNLPWNVCCTIHICIFINITQPYYFFYATPICHGATGTGQRGAWSM